MPGQTEDEAARLIDKPAEQPTTTQQEAVHGATPAQHGGPCERSFRERLREFYEKYPLPEPTGLKADKAFFDEICGEFDREG